MLRACSKPGVMHVPAGQGSAKAAARGSAGPSSTPARSQPTVQTFDNGREDPSNQARQASLPLRGSERHRPSTADDQPAKRPRRAAAARALPETRGRAAAAQVPEPDSAGASDATDSSGAEDGQDATNETSNDSLSEAGSDTDAGSDADAASGSEEAASDGDVAASGDAAAEGAPTKTPARVYPPPPLPVPPPGGVHRFEGQSVRVPEEWPTEPRTGTEKLCPELKAVIVSVLHPRTIKVNTEGAPHTHTHTDRHTHAHANRDIACARLFIRT